MEQVWWYATRAAGLMTWSAALASVLVGLTLSIRPIRSRAGQWVLDLHRFLGGLTAVFLLLHLVSLWADSHVEFGWREMIVPGESQWRPQAVAWGVVAAWILIAVEVTSILRRHIGQTLWRWVHWMSLLVIAGGTVHGLQAGSDTENPLIWAAAGAGSLVLIVLGSIRLRGSDRPTTSRRPTTETEILLEMRQRLADLPVQGGRSPLEYAADASSPLPRRAARADGEAALPGGGALLDALGRAARSAAAPPPDPPFANDPFEAVPEREPVAEPATEPVADVGPWPGRSAADPFGDESSPFTTPAPEPEPAPEPAPEPDAEQLPVRRAGETTHAPAPDIRAPGAPRPFVDPAEVREPPAVADPPPERTPDLTRSPFGPPPLPALAPPPVYKRPTPSPFETRPHPVEPEAQPPERPANPFGEIEPSTISLTSPPPPAPSPPQSVIAPPLPEHAINPSTGEPDEAAYRLWLVEWLAFAEQYGDEAPRDPSRF